MYLKYKRMSNGRHLYRIIEQLPFTVLQRERRQTVTASPYDTPGRIIIKCGQDIVWNVIRTTLTKITIHARFGSCTGLFYVIMKTDADCMTGRDSNTLTDTRRDSFLRRGHTCRRNTFVHNFILLADAAIMLFQGPARQVVFLTNRRVSSNPFFTSAILQQIHNQRQLQL